MANLAGSYGCAVTLTAPSRVQKGEFCIVGSVAGIAADTIENGERGVVILDGVFSLRKRANSVAIAEGQKVYSANSLSSVNNVSGQGHTVFVGYALNASASGTSTPVDVLLVRIGM